MNSMKTTQDSLLEVIVLGKNILLEYKDKPKDQLIYSALLVLLNIESILDRGRTLPDSHNTQTLSEINKGMDEIRAGILALMKNLDKTELKSVLFSAGEEFKTNFISNI